MRKKDKKKRYELICFTKTESRYYYVDAIDKKTMKLLLKRYKEFNDIRTIVIWDNTFKRTVYFEDVPCGVFQNNFNKKGFNNHIFALGLHWKKVI